MSELKKKIIVLSIVFGLIVVGFASIAIVHYSSRAKQTRPTHSVKANQLILFYGIGCPHCVKVDAFMEKNKKMRLIALEEKEVYYDRANQLDLIKKVSNDLLNKIDRKIRISALIADEIKEKVL